MKILGIDPGIGRLGWGMIAKEERRLKVLGYGMIETAAGSAKTTRLTAIYAELTAVMGQQKPDLVAVEELFFSKNITTAMSVAEARGIVMLVIGQANVPFVTFSPMSVKSALGFGGAKKPQVSAMVKMILGTKEKFAYDDIADALAVAICASQRVKIDNR